MSALPQLHQLVNQIARTVVEELADSLETEFAEKPWLNQLETLQQVTEQQDSWTQRLGLQEIRQSLFTLSANLLMLRKAVMRLQEKTTNDKGKTQTQPDGAAPPPSHAKRKSPSVEHQATATHMPVDTKPLTQKSKVSPDAPQSPTLALVLSTNNSLQPQYMVTGLRQSSQPPATDNIRPEPLS